MIAEKWNTKAHKYEPVQLPGSAKIYSDNMQELIQCARCGKTIAYGESYTSLLIHNKVGFGYGVCEDCHSEEIKQRIDEKKYDKE